MKTRQPAGTDHAKGGADPQNGRAPAIRFEETSRVFKALGHPTRLRLACGLCRESSSLTRIQGTLGESISTLAQHIAVLRRSGILVEERRGPEIFLHVRDARVRRLLATLCSEYTAEPPPEWAWERLRKPRRSPCSKERET